MSSNANAHVSSIVTRSISAAWVSAALRAYYSAKRSFAVYFRPAQKNAPRTVLTALRRTSVSHPDGFPFLDGTMQPRSSSPSPRYPRPHGKNGKGMSCSTGFPAPLPRIPSALVSYSQKRPPIRLGGRSHRLGSGRIGPNPAYSFIRLSSSVSTITGRSLPKYGSCSGIVTPFETIWLETLLLYTVRYATFDMEGCPFDAVTTQR